MLVPLRNGITRIDFFGALHFFIRGCAIYSLPVRRPDGAAASSPSLLAPPGARDAAGRRASSDHPGKLGKRRPPPRQGPAENPIMRRAPRRIRHSVGESAGSPAAASTRGPYERRGKQENAGDRNAGRKNETVDGETAPNAGRETSAGDQRPHTTETKKAADTRALSAARRLWATSAPCQFCRSR